MFANDSNINGSSTGNNLNDVVKTQGFVDTTTGSGSGAATLKADAYYTYNLEVKKTLVNDAANNAQRISTQWGISREDFRKNCED